MLKILLSLFFFVTIFCFSQSKADINNMKKIDSIVFSNLAPKEDSSYLIYSAGEKIIVIDSISRYVNYLNMKSHIVIKSKKISKNNITNLFKERNIKKGEKFSTNYDDSCIGAFVYLAYIKKNTVQTVFNLPYMLLCSKNDIKYPYDYKMLSLLHKLIDE